MYKIPATIIIKFDAADGVMFYRCLLDLPFYPFPGMVYMIPGYRLMLKPTCDPHWDLRSQRVVLFFEEESPSKTIAQMDELLGVCSKDPIEAWGHQMDREWAKLRANPYKGERPS